MFESVWSLGMHHDETRRKMWFRGLIYNDWARGKLSPQLAEKLVQQGEDPIIKRHLKDVLVANFDGHYFGFTASIGLGFLGYQIESTPLIAYALFQHTPLVPKIGLGGIFRATWLTKRVIQDHVGNKEGRRLLSKKKEASNILMTLISPLGIGHLSATIRMAKEAPEVSSYLAEYFIERIGKQAESIPLVGRFSGPIQRIAEKYYEKVRS